ncbi:MAG: CBS domain-containing protein [Cyanobacteria bacterium J06623_5]
MTSSSSLAVMPSITSAIERHVLKVSPDTSVATVVYQMSAAEGEGCSLSQDDSDSRKRISCAVVVENETVVGICTERDIVRLTATKLSLLRSLSKIPVSQIMTRPVKTLEESSLQDIFAVLFLFRRYRIRHLPIVNAQQQIIGMVTPSSIRAVLRPANLLKMRRVADVMSKGVIQAPTTARIIELAKKMADHRVSCVVIVEPSVSEEAGGPVNRPVGIVTERDIVQFQTLELNLQSVTAGEVMSAPLFLLSPQDSLWSAHEAMQARRVRRLVVSWNWGKGLGIVTQTSLLRVFDPIEMCGIIDSLQSTVQQLQIEQSSPAETENPIGGLLGAAIEKIAIAQTQSQLTDQQKQQLQQATQLIEQVNSTCALPVYE